MGAMHGEREPRTGDVVIVHRNSTYSVGVIPQDGEEEAYAPHMVFGKDAAVELARKLVADATGRIFLSDENDEWSELS